jgi:hypothetical protein
MGELLLGIGGDGSVSLVCVRVSAKRVSVSADVGPCANVGFAGEA